MIISANRINSFNELYDVLKCDIYEGRIEERLPSIMQLCNLYGLSHCTVKKVLYRLKIQKYIEGHKGKFIQVNKLVVGNPLFQKNIVFYLHINTMGKLLSHSSISAVFSFSDILALGIYLYCNDHGVKIPEDISILSFDNLPFSELLSPSLSTFSEDSETIAKSTADLIKRITVGERNISTELIKAVFIERDSVIKI